MKKVFIKTYQLVRKKGENESTKKVREKRKSETTVSCKSLAFRLLLMWTIKQMKIKYSPNGIIELCTALEWNGESCTQPKRRTPGGLLYYITLTRVSNLNEPVRLMACLQLQKQSESWDLCQAAHFHTRWLTATVISWPLGGSRSKSSPEFNHLFLISLSTFP